MNWRATMMGTECRVSFDRYRAGSGRNVAILLETAENPEPYDTVTTWIPGLADDEVAIRDDELPDNCRWESMVRAEIIYPNPVDHRRSNWITIPVYRLTPGALKAGGGK